MVKGYVKGARAERNLIKQFSDRGFLVMRAAGSGVNSLSPDILAFRHGLQYAIEAKARDSERLSLDRDQFDNLKGWEKEAGITTYVAWKRKRERWLFVPLSVFREAKGSYSISWEQAKMIARDLAEMGE